MLAWPRETDYLLRLSRGRVLRCPMFECGHFELRTHARADAVASLREAVELYFEDAPAADFTLVSEAEVGQELVHA